MPTKQLLDLDTITLDKGSHPPDDGLCLMEAVALAAAEPHSDSPDCTSPILSIFGRTLNDVLPDAKRQLLKPLIPRLVGTADDDLDQARGLMAADWLIRTYTPTWLRRAGLEEQAVTLETLPRQASWDDVEAAVPVLAKGKKKAAPAGAAAGAAAGDAAGAAARYAAWDAAWYAAWDAAGDAAWDAALDAAGDAARYAARYAARAAAWYAAWDAAGDAAWDAALDAARDAARYAARYAARAAARDAARDKLKSTVEQLQDSAITLFEWMIDGRESA